MGTKPQPHFDPTDIRGLARLISQVEAGEPEALARMAQVYAAGKGAYRLGVTGPPGAGKSTLVDQLIRHLRAQGKRVAIVAIDPSSPFSGGAVLGDRIRMQAHAGDDGVYIRSVGARGARGGLSAATRAITRIYDAYGFDWIIIETVGVGQSEFDIMELADTTLVVLVPEAGDTVQTLKAGLLEVADIFAVNKADRAGADQMANALSAMIGLGRFERGQVGEEHDATHRIVAVECAAQAEPVEQGWQAPVLSTVATKGEGVEQLLATIERHRAHVQRDPKHRQHQCDVRRQEFLELCGMRCIHRVRQAIAESPELTALVEAVARGEANPYHHVDEILDKIIQ